MPVIFCLLTLVLCCQPALAGDATDKVPALEKIASLSDPAKLITLKSGNRAGNSRFRKLMAFANEAETRDLPPAEFFAALYGFYEEKPYVTHSHVFAPKAEMLNLEAQYRLGKIYGLYTEQNIALLKRGRAPIITRGKHIGEKAEVDHLIPFRSAPELEQSMANLTWMPASENRSKGAKFTNAARRRAEALREETGWVFRQ